MTRHPSLSPLLVLVALALCLDGCSGAVPVEAQNAMAMALVFLIVFAAYVRFLTWIWPELREA